MKNACWIVVGLFAFWAGSLASADNGNPNLAIDAEPILERNQLTGEWFGGRPTLSDRGVEFLCDYTAEVWGNTLGGVKEGSVYTGLLVCGVEMDLEKVLGWKGASASTTWLWFSGRDASEDLVGNFLTVSNISGFSTFRMFESWFQQNLLEEKLSIRLGQISADSEFLVSDYAGLFINSTFGWPAVAYVNLPEGGPAFPMGTLGTRVAWNPNHWFTYQNAVFQGNVFAQDVNRHGFRWRLNSQTGVTIFSEAQCRWNAEECETGLSGQFKAGAWFQTGTNADPLAQTTSSGNSGYYAIIDQMILRERAPLSASTQKSDQGLACFSRVSFTPADRNVVDFYFDAGITCKGCIPTRDDDTAGLGFGMAQLSSGAQASLGDENGGALSPEMVVEFTYQSQITPWLVVQPDIQYLINPSGSSQLSNAFVIGARAAIIF